MTVHSFLRAGSRAPSGLSAGSPCRERNPRPPLLLAALALSALSVIDSPAAGAQEDRIVQLEFAHDQAEASYEAALAELNGREVEYVTTSQAFDNALAAGNAEANQAYVAIQQALWLRSRAERQLGARAAELRDARRNLLEARRLYLGELLAQAAIETDPVEQRNLAVFVDNTSQEMARLRALPEPRVTLEPLPEINVETTDGPIELRRKAGILEFAANRYEEQQAYFQQRVEDLRTDQSLFRRSSDFLADRVRFGDRPPVGAPTGRTLPPPELLDQQIQELEMLQEDLTTRIQTIRIRAADLRRLAGGEWA